jgi:RimJ/RimL family protein N-acetyltransferase
MTTDPVVLRGSKLVLKPMERVHAQDLVAASRDGDVWRSRYTIIPTADSIGSYIDALLQARAEGTTLAFVSTLAHSGQVVGTSRLFQIDAKNRKLEIGGTWIGASWQRTFVNTEAKYLMLRYAFEVMGCLRVFFQTDALNAQSRAALLRLGAKEEGIIRNERIMPDGRQRDSAQYSIIDTEWEGVRHGLEARLAAYGMTPAFQVEAVAKAGN